MSISNLAYEAVTKRPPLTRHLRSATEAANLADNNKPDEVGREQQDNSDQRDDSNGGALETLTHYIPTEIITLYVATLAAKPALKSALPAKLMALHPSAIWIYVFYAVLTPALFALIFVSESYKRYGTLRTDHKWPWWQNVASTIAFLAWGISVPTNPVLENSVLSAVAGLFSLIVSALLVRFDPIFDPTKRDQPPDRKSDPIRQPEPAAPSHREPAPEPERKSAG